MGAMNGIETEDSWTVKKREQSAGSLWFQWPIKQHLKKVFLCSYFDI